MEFKHPLHVGAPNVGNKDQFYKYTEEMFDRNWLTNHGELVLQFEEELQNYLGVKHCIALCNGTVALEIAIRGLGLSGEVIVPSLTFVATAHALQWQEITPIFCDVDPVTLCLDPSEVERHITPRTTGIIGVHVYGHCCEVDALQKIADTHQLTLMFDAAHAFGHTHHGRKIGSFGACEVFSFHATKFFNSFEGGAVATNNDELAKKIRYMQNFGFSGDDCVEHVGLNGKMTEVCAAMGLTNLRCLDQFRAINLENYTAYARGFEGIQGLRLIRNEANDISNKHYVVVEVMDEFALSRDALQVRLQAENILVRRYFWPGCHRLAPYNKRQPNAGVLLPVTEKILAKILLFPTGTALNPEMIRRVLALVESWASSTKKS
ncbi:MAG: DegT/DnrJ/EryC1/StrS family aminotransferase [Pontiella sp.]